jgi:hypothetical protein
VGKEAAESPVFLNIIYYPVSLNISYYIQNPRVKNKALFSLNPEIILWSELCRASFT